MIPFPVIHSILSPTELAAWSQRQYAFTDPATCKLLKTGINHTYQMVTGDVSYILRVYTHNWRTSAEIAEEINLLLDLKQKGLSVAYPLSDPAGCFIQTLQAPEGTRYAVLFHYAPGEKQPQYPEELHFAVGQWMAQFHQHTQNRSIQRTAYDPQTLLHEAMASIRPFLAEDVPEMQFLIQTLPRLVQTLQDAVIEHIRQGVVHLDIWFDNLHFSEDATVTVFDFDFCGNGWLCLDLAYYVMQVYHLEGKDQARLSAYLAAFYRGYLSMQSISQAERQLIPILGVVLYYFYLGVQCQHFDHWSNTFLNKTYLQKYITLFIQRYDQADPAILQPPQDL